MDPITVIIEIETGIETPDGYDNVVTEHSLVVTTASDVVDANDGVTSLREAVVYANSLEGEQTITFDVKDGDTIVLDRMLGVYSSLVIDGVNAATGNNVTVRPKVTYAEAQAQSSTASDYALFHISCGSFTMRDMTVMGGSESAVQNPSGHVGNLTLLNVTAQDSFRAFYVFADIATVDGFHGSNNIRGENFGHDMLVTNSTFENYCMAADNEYNGGFIVHCGVEEYTHLTVINSTFLNNESLHSGAAFYMDTNHTALLINCTIDNALGHLWYGNSLCAARGGTFKVLNTIVVTPDGRDQPDIGTYESTNKVRYSVFGSAGKDTKVTDSFSEYTSEDLFVTPDESSDNSGATPTLILRSDATVLNNAVLAAYDPETRTLYYSADNGKTWKNFDDGTDATVNPLWIIVTDQEGNSRLNCVNKIGASIRTDKGITVKIDSGENDYLYDKKKGVNGTIADSDGILLKDDLRAIRFDKEGAISEEIDGVTYNNFVGQNDETDYLKITLDKAAKLSFDLNATDATKLVVYSLSKTKNSYKQKTLQTTVLGEAGSTTTKGLLLEAGDYYLSVQSINAADSGSAFYNVGINEEESLFFSEGDNSDDWTDLKTNGDDSEEFFDAGILDAGTDSLLNGWVGFGDEVDYAKFTLNSAAKLFFQVEASDAAKLTVYSLSRGKKGYSLKSLQTTTLKKAGTATSKSLLLDAGEYYLSMKSSNAAKGGSADYVVEMNGKSVFFVDADDGENGWLYDKKTKTVNEDDNFVTTEITAGTDEILFDDAGVSVDGYMNFVGYGDAADYAKITLSAAAKLSFSIESTDSASFIVYSLTEKNGKYKVKALQTTKVKKASSTRTKALSLDAGEYFISMQSTNAKSGGAAYYNVSLNSGACSGLPESAQVADALAFAQSSPETMFAGVAEVQGNDLAWQSLLA